MKKAATLSLLKITILLIGLLPVFNRLPVFGQQKAATHKTATRRDGRHDFDFNFGKWRTHIQTLQQPLSGSTTWVKLEGTVTVRKVWDGRASLEEIEADRPSGHFEGTTIFLYNPESHQWSQTFASSAAGTLEVPSVGEFKNGRGEFFSQENYKGRMVLVRGIWSEIATNSHKFEQAYSDDGGKTWKTNFIAKLDRIN